MSKKISIFLLLTLCFSKVQSQNLICPTTTLNDGWVVIGIKGGNDCPKGQKWEIKNVKALPTESIVHICVRQIIPSGWILIDEKICTCCHPTDNETKYWKIKRIDGLPIGTIEYTCDPKTKPDGWEVIQEKTCTCCHPEDNNTKQWVIQRIE